jgi:monoamine oxidase
MFLNQRIVSVVAAFAGGSTSETALYWAVSADIDRVLIVDWSREPWAMACEARDYQPGQLHKFWPAAIEPVGRVYFSGAYCDNQSWGMEAATRSAVRAARAIHEVGMHE